MRGVGFVSVVLVSAALAVLPVTAAHADTVGTIGDLSYQYNDANIAAGAQVVAYSGSGGDLVIPDTVTFDGNTYPVTSIAPNGPQVFNGVGLTSVVLPSQLVAIGDYVFYGNAITSLVIPDTVITLGNGAFMENQIADLTWGNSVQTIGNFAFYGNQLTSVDIPDSVLTIGESSFWSNKLISVTLGNSVQTIGKYAFLGSAGYNQIAGSLLLPETLTLIGDGAFQGSQLTGELVIPAAVTSIGNTAFAGGQLDALTFSGSSSLTSIGGAAFAGNEIASLDLPNTVTQLGTYAFQSNKLTSLTLSTGLTDIGIGIFYDNLLTSVVIPDSVQTIGNGAFMYNKLTSLVIPDSVTVIGWNAFRENEIASLTLGNSLTVIDHISFYKNKLTSVTIPASVTAIGNATFSGNPDLATVCFSGDAPAISTYLPPNVNASFGSNTNKVLYAQHTATGFTFPTWNTWDTQAVGYTATFDAQGGTAVASTTTSCGNTTVAAPSPDPTRVGHSFTGWFTDAAGTVPADFAAPVTADVTLYAGWQLNSYTVSYDANGAAGSYANDVVDHGTLLSVPSPEPVRPDHTFTGWFTDAAGIHAYDFAAPVTADTTLYAGWKLNSYTIHYQTQGGSALSPVTVRHGDPIAAPQHRPVRPGYTFTGWFTDAAGTVPADFTAPVTADLTLYAGWAVNAAAGAGMALQHTGGVIAPGLVLAGAALLIAAGAITVAARRGAGRQRTRATPASK